MSTGTLPDDALLEAQQRAKLKMKDSLQSILVQLSAAERCSLVFLVLSRQELVQSGYTLCQYCAADKDIKERLWRGCGGNVEALLLALYHLCRFDLLQNTLGLCSTHSMEQVCLSLSGLECERLALYRVFAALPQQTADLILSSQLSQWLCPETGRPLEETFCRNLLTSSRYSNSSSGGSGSRYKELITELHAALTASSHLHLATLLAPHVQETLHQGHGAGASVPRDEVYHLPSSHPYGLCVIINVNSFIEAPDPTEEVFLRSRRGSSIDTLRLEGTFRLFGFEILHLKDPDSMKINTLFANLKRDPRLGSLACLVVCIMTHGDNDDRLFLHDRTSIALSDLRSLCFTPLLINKPRLFFVQACRGKQVLPPIFLQHDLMTGPGGVVTQAVNRESDCLVCSATVKGYSAMRSQSAGSWFISDLCDALQQIGHVSPMRSVLQLARRSLNDRVDHLGNHLVMQTSEDITTLLKEVQLVRGTESHFSHGGVLLMLLELLEVLIDEAVDQYCGDLNLDSACMTRLLRQLDEEEQYQALGY